MSKLKNNFEYRIQKYNKYKDINIHDNNIIVLYYTDTNGFSCIVSYLYINNFTENIEYICAGNNIISRDGSYMSNFLKIKDIEQIPQSYLKKIQIYLSEFKDRLYFKTVYGKISANIKKIDKIFIFAIYCIISYYNHTKDRLEELSTIKKKIIIKYGILSKEIINNINSVSNLFGQKIIPQGYYYKEGNFIKYRDFSNEIEINYIMTKDTFKNRSPAYSIIINYTTIISNKNNIEDIWDNETIKNKLYNSKLLKKTYKNDKIYILVNEYCGNTIIQYFQNNDILLGDLRNNNYDIKCFIFQIVYGISILHDAGYIHGDLHINNISVRKSYKTYKTTTKKNEVSIFSLGNLESNNYKINFYGGYATILDFGRVIKFEQLEKNKEYFFKKIENATGIKLDSKFETHEFIKCCVLMDIYKFIESLCYLIHTENYITEGIVNMFKTEISKFMKNIIKGKYKTINIKTIIIHYISNSELFEELRQKNNVLSNDKNIVDKFNY